MMNLLRIGMISAYGVGMGAFEGALRKPELAHRAQAREEYPSFQVHLDEVQDKSLLKKIRRAGRLSKMAVLAAQDAMPVAPPEPSRVGLILATALGPHPTTFAFLDDILRFGDVNVSPTVFSNSVHNAPAAYVAETLGIRGPTLTVTRFFHAFHEALRLAQCWLDEARCDRVMVGAADEHGEVLQYVLNTLLVPPRKRTGDTMTTGGEGLLPAEGAVFFLLGQPEDQGGLCVVHSVSPDFRGTSCPEPDLRIVELDGLIPGGVPPYPVSAGPAGQVAGYTHVYGSMLTGSGFAAAAAALMLHRQYLFACPAQAVPEGLSTISSSGPGPVQSISCERLNCQGEKMVIYMTRNPLRADAPGN